jgi:hypothetical protein
MMDPVALNKTRKCKDPRDRVYSVLALSRCQTPGFTAITADYAITPVELFFRVTEAHNAVVLNNGYYSRIPLVEALELDESLICDSLPDCSPAACLKGHTVSCDGPIFIRAVYQRKFDLSSRSQVLKETEGSVRQWFKYAPDNRVGGLCSPVDPVVSGAGGHQWISIHSLHDFGRLAFVHRCDPDEPAASIACAEKASQQSNLENLDAIATEALWGPERRFSDQIVDLHRPSRPLKTVYLKRITEPCIFDLKGITVVQRPSLECEDFVLALCRRKYASLMSTCLEIQHVERYISFMLRAEERRRVRELNSSSDIISSS